MIDWAKAMSPRTFSALPRHTKYATNSSTDTVRHGPPDGWCAQKYAATCSERGLTRPSPALPRHPRLDRGAGRPDRERGRQQKKKDETVKSHGEAVAVVTVGSGAGG